MNEYSNKIFLKTLFLQLVLLLCISIFSLFYNRRFLYLLLIPIANIGYISCIAIKGFRLQFGVTPMAEENACNNSVSTTHIHTNFYLNNKSTKENSLVLTEKNKVEGKKEVECGRKMLSFKKYVLKRVIRPFIKNYDKYNNNYPEYCDRDTSFQLNNSFIFDHKLQTRHYVDKKAILCQRLSNNISEEGIRILRKISECGWIFYQKSSSKHRMTMFQLLVNYFNFLIPSYESIYLDPFDEFIKKGPYGIAFDGPIYNGNFYFYSKGFSKNDGGDPIVAFLYLLVYCKEYCSEMLGPFSISDFTFLN